MKKRIIIICSVCLVAVICFLLLFILLRRDKQVSEVVEESVSTDTVVEVPKFEDVSGEMVEQVTTDNIDAQYNDNAHAFIRELLDEDTTIQMFDFDYEFVLDKEIDYREDNGPLLVQGHIVNSDIGFIINYGGKYDEDVFFLESVNNIYGSDYSSVYWEDGIPSDAMDIYEMLAENQLTDVYRAKAIDGGYELYSLYFKKTIYVLYDDNGVCYWSDKL